MHIYIYFFFFLLANIWPSTIPMFYGMHDSFISFIFFLTSALKPKFAESKEISELAHNFVMVNLEVSIVASSKCALNIMWCEIGFNLLWVALVKRDVRWQTVHCHWLALFRWPNSSFRSFFSQFLIPSFILHVSSHCHIKIKLKKAERNFCAYKI